MFKPARGPVAAAAGMASFLLVASCAQKPSDPARALVEELAAAGEARDADRILARLSDGFRGQDGLVKADAQASLRRYFAAYESLDVEVFDVTVEPGEGSTRIRTRIGFSGKARRGFGLEGLLLPSAVYRFELEARDEGGTWRVSRAVWEVAVPEGGVDRGVDRP
jgi:hypothetical protein